MAFSKALARDNPLFRDTERDREQLRTGLPKRVLIEAITAATGSASAATAIAEVKREYGCGEGTLPEFKYLTCQLSDAEAWRKSVSNTAEQVLIKAEIIRKQLQERARTVASSRAAGGVTAAATPVAAARASAGAGADADATADAVAGAIAGAVAAATAPAGADTDVAAGAVADAVAATAAPTPPPLATPPVPPPATAVEAAATTGAVEVAQAQALLARSTTALTPPASLGKSEARGKRNFLFPLARLANRHQTQGLAIALARPLVWIGSTNRDQSPNGSLVSSSGPEQSQQSRFQNQQLRRWVPKFVLRPDRLQPLAAITFVMNKLTLSVGRHL